MLHLGDTFVIQLSDFPSMAQDKISVVNRYFSSTQLITYITLQPIAKNCPTKIYLDVYTIAAHAMIEPFDSSYFHINKFASNKKEMASWNQQTKIKEYTAAN